MDKKIKSKKKLVPILECRWNCGTHYAMGRYGRCYSCNDFESKKIIKNN